jgi:hypothetical protein
VTIRSAKRNISTTYSLAFAVKAIGDCLPRNPMLWLPSNLAHDQNNREEQTNARLDDESPADDFIAAAARRAEPQRY